MIQGHAHDNPSGEGIDESGGSLQQTQQADAKYKWTGVEQQNSAL